MATYRQQCPCSGFDPGSIRAALAAYVACPLPVFLATARPEEARTAVLNLGEDINAAANICNKNLGRRDYGVSRTLKDYLFDHDAMGPLTGVKVRTNKAASTARMDIPDRFFEEGTIFLPEEMMVGLRIDDPGLRAPLPWPTPS